MKRAEFTAVFTEYEQSQEVTRTRLFLEAIEDILPGVTLFILDDSTGGAVPLLPLTEGVLPSAAGPVAGAGNGGLSMKLLVPFLILVIAAVIVVPQALYTVDETQYVVVTRFGEIQNIVRTPGLKVKAPFVDTANVLDKRILRIDVTPTSMPDQDNQFLEVDAYVPLPDRGPAASSSSACAVRATPPPRSSRSSSRRSATRWDAARSRRSSADGSSVSRRTAPPSSRLLNDQGVATRAAIVARALTTANEVVKSPENDFGVDIVDIRIKRARLPGRDGGQHLQPHENGAFRAGAATPRRRRGVVPPTHRRRRPAGGDHRRPG